MYLFIFLALWRLAVELRPAAGPQARRTAHWPITIYRKRRGVRTTYANTTVHIFEELANKKKNPV